MEKQSTLERQAQPEAAAAVAGRAAAAIGDAAASRSVVPAATTKDPTGAIAR